MGTNFMLCRLRYDFFSAADELFSEDFFGFKSVAFNLVLVQLGLLFEKI